MNTLYTYPKCVKSIRGFYALSKPIKIFSSFYKSIILLATIGLLPLTGFAQMVGPSCYVKGTYVEYGVNGAGGFEGIFTGVSPVPAGMHFRSGNPIFGFVANPQANGWATFDGDYFTPGSPENGWGIEIINGATNLLASNNCQDAYFGGINGIPGAITSYQVIGSCRIVRWDGDYINGAYNVHVRLDYILNVNDLYYTTVVTLTNNGISIPDFYYYRNFDPDNNQSAPGGEFPTTNTVMSQPGSGCNKAHVRATSTLPASQPLSYVGLAGVGANFRACYGGFSNRDGSDLWNGIGFTQATATPMYADIAIALAYRVQNFNAGNTESFRFVVILDDVAANNAINNLFSMTWPGAPPSSSTACNPVVDTVTICNGGSTTISVTGSAVSDFTWSWSPTIGLSPTVGATVTASPTVNTLYTVTGAPINPCFNPVTQQIYVKVVPGTTNANAGTNRVLTCTTLTAVLGGSTTTPGSTYSWAGPGIVSGGTTLTPTVNAPGVYTLTVTAGGCSASDTMSVILNNTPPNANAGPDRVITCSTPVVTFAGSSTTPGVTYAWSGPGITGGATTATPTANAAGNYTVTITNPANGCTATDVAVVTVNNTPPNANAGLDQTLTCAITSLNLSGSSSTGGVTCAWTGPGITAGGTTWTPAVNAPGNYTVTVTNPANGCTSTDVVVVNLNNTPPNANAGPDRVITCTTPVVTFAGSSTTPGVTYAWSGPGITGGATTATPTANAAGNYTVTVTNPANGCTATDVAVVTVNTTPPNANAGLDQTITCTTPTLNLSGSSSTGGVTCAWTGPGITAGGTTWTPTVNAGGSYTVTVTNPANGCTSTDVVVVNLNNTPPNSNAGLDQTLTCLITSLNLSGSSSTPGVNYNWTGPGITAGGTTTTPTVNAGGTYTITVTNPANGCTSTDMVVVNVNNTPPNANAGPDQNLTCAVSSLNLSGSSSTPGATFSWGGPGITAGGTTATPTVNVAGTYTLTVTNPSNGCTATDMVVVNGSATIPNSNAGPDQTLTCAITSLNLSGSSTTPSVTYGWTGPGITAGGTTATPTVNAPGTYTVTVTSTASGCTSTDIVVVNQNITPPNANAGPDQVLNCVITSVNLSGSSTTGGITYSWAGPGITAGGTTSTPTVNAAGPYTVTITDPTNGCTSTDITNVTLNNTLPNANAGLDQTLTCVVTSLNLSGSSTTGGVTYAWAGPAITAGGTTNTPTVNGAGTYTVTITDPSNGCTNTDQVVVNLNNTPPNANAGPDDILNCTITSINLAGSSTTGGATYAWGGPAITAGGTTATPTVNGAGTYTVTVTDPINGCTSTDQMVVTLNATLPNANAGPDAILNCSITALNLAGSSTTGGVTYAWSGPGITGGGTTPTPNINAPGTYIVTVTNPSNGCTSTDVVNVTQNITPPNANAGPDQILNCVITALNLSGSSTTGGVTYAWSGPGITGGGTTSTPNVNAPGTYMVTITDPGNGCTSTDQTDVTLNNTPPNANAGPDDILNCVITSVNLAGSSTTGGVTYAWGGPAITSGGATSTPTVNGPGTYTVTITDPINGCTSTDMVVVNLNNTIPNANAGPDDILNCVITSINLAGSSTTGGVTYAWGGPAITSGGATSTPTVNGAGTYTVTITDPINGCTNTDQIVVTLNATLPNVSAGPDDILNCSITALNLNGSSTTGGVTYAWTGPGITGGGTTSTPNINAPGTYIVTVTDPSNGCTNTDVVDVAQNIVAPSINAGLDDVLNCLVLDLNLNGSSTTAGVSYVWAGPSITSGANTNTPNVNGPGSYTVTVTDPANGCTSTDVVDIALNNTIPNLAMGANQNILCNTPMVNVTGNSSTPGVTYVWSGPGLVGGYGSSVATANTAGTYSVTVTDPVNGCTASGTVDVILDLNIPSANFLADNLSSCAPLCATLTDQSLVNGSPIVGWNWVVEGIGTSNATGGTFCFTDPGTYDVTLTVTTADGCTSTLNIPNYLTVHANPVADFLYTPQLITIFAPEVTFGNTTVGATTYAWDFGDGNTSTLENPKHMYADTGYYCVNLLATSNFGCVDTITHCLYVKPEFTLYIPNSFTVNDDGLNETWNIYGMGIVTVSARIFDRWGEEIFFFDNIAKGWPGTMQNGNPCPQGVYVYRIEVMDGQGDYHEYIGNVNLIR